MAMCAFPLRPLPSTLLGSASCVADRSRTANHAQPNRRCRVSEERFCWTQRGTQLRATSSAPAHVCGVLNPHVYATSHALTRHSGTSRGNARIEAGETQIYAGLDIDTFTAAVAHATGDPARPW